MIERVTVLDAGPLIHLDELDALDLLEGFRHIYVPLAVKDEVAVHRPKLDYQQVKDLKVWTSVLEHSPVVKGYAQTLELDSGEIAALNLLKQLQGQLLLCDDSAARLAAESMGLEVHGTLGIIIRAIRRG